MKAQTLAQQIEVVRRYAERLCQAAGEAPSHRAALAETFGELQSALGALRVAEEELRQQTEELAAAREMAEAERQRSRELFEFGPDGYLATDEGGTIREANRAAAALLNVSQRFLVGKPLSVFIEDKDLGPFRWTLNQLRRVDRVRELAVRIRPRGTASVDGVLTAFAVRDREGARVGLRWILRDVTARKRAEELEAAYTFQAELLASEQAVRAEAEAAQQRLALLAEASSRFAASLDYRATLNTVARFAIPAFAEGCVVDIVGDGSPWHVAVAHVNPAKEALLGEMQRRYSIDWSSDSPVARVIRAAEPVVMPEVSDTLLQSVTRDAEHLRMMRELGIASSIIVPLRAQDRVVGAITFHAGESGRRYGPADLAVARDLAERAALAIDNARLFNEIQEADRRKDAFLAMLAHELRNPLASITNAVQVLHRAPEAKTAELLTILGRQTTHLAHLLDDLLDVARIKTGKITLHRRSLDVTVVARRSLESLRTSGKARRHAVSLSEPSEPVFVHGDPDRLEQVIGNLLDNAVKYTPPEGLVHVAVEREGGDAVVRVQDSGMGIAPDLLPRIFEPFSQAETARHRSQSGLGLGLAVVRGLVTRHEGTVTAHSAGLGQGSEFVVRLPLDTAPGTPTEDDSAPSAAPSRRILVVEDNADAREAVRTLLLLWGHHVEVAEDGRGGVAMALARRPEVALVDLGLPDLDGYEVARQIRALPEGGRIHLVALTGYGQPEDRRKAQEAGFDAHMVKPADPDTLSRILAGLKARG